MRLWLARSVATVLVLGAVVGCGGSRSETDGAINVDPQVMQDVVDATFMIPGPEMLRAMRVQEFGRQKGIEKCGGTPAPIDGTSGRFDQAHFPNLDLIRERGFSEQAAVEGEDRQLEGLDEGCDLTPEIPSYNAWKVLTDPWIGVVKTADQDVGLAPLKGPMADCLVRRTGLAVERSDPTMFLRLVNLADVKGASPRQLKNFAAAYADCGEPYFAKFRELLLKKRPALVERHREAIEQYASDIVDAGYVP